jgi:hypothetical protein
MPIRNRDRSSSKPQTPKPRRARAGQGRPAGRPTAAQAGPAAGAGEVEIKAPRGVSRGESNAATRRAADKLLDVVTQHKDRDGKMALEGWGKGDARVTERRGAVGTLLSDKTGRFVDEAKLKQISKEIAADIEFEKTVERKEYTLDGAGQFSWYRPFNNNTVTDRILQREYESRVEAQRELATGLLSGDKKFMDVSALSVVGLALLPDDELRSDAMMDALLQFRARQDLANQKEDGWTTRIDRFGLALLAEQRVLLASVELDGKSPQSERDYALLREVISSHPISSTNGIYEARNAVAAILTDQGRSSDRMSSENSPTAWIWKKVPPGASASPYSSIHHNFSRDTPKNIRAFVEEWMFPLGPRALRPVLFVALVNAMSMARKGTLDQATTALNAAIATMEQADPSLKPFATGIKKIVAKASAGDPGADDKVKATWLADAVRDVLKQTCTQKLGTNVEANLEMAARTFVSVCAGQPTIDTLEKDLFRAGDARGAVADVIVAMRNKNDQSVLREIGEARLAMKDAIVRSRSGVERHDLIKLDAQLLRLSNEHLGAAVDRVGTLSTNAERSECMIALQSALRSALASGLQAIKTTEDEKASSGDGIAKALELIDGALKKGRISEDEYRKVMSSAFVAVRETVQDIRAFADARAAEVARGGMQLDPEFIDQFIKQSPLHYATALAEKGLRVGLVEKITPRSIENVAGMRVLNGVGPVVFQSVVFAENGKELAAMGTSKDQLAVLYQLEEKKMVAVGGLFVDTEQAPGGNSHLNMYAMNNGIPVVALPELRTKYAAFFKTAAKEGGIYVDDSGDGFKMLTVKKAIEDGLVPGASASDAKATAEALEKLRAGVNRRITFVKPASAGEGFEVAARHDAIINDKRVTRDVVIFVPQEAVGGIGRGVPTFEELAPLGIRARHLAGEKGTVLALLSQHPILGKHVPQGSQITPGDIRDMLAGAPLGDGRTLLDAWDDVWNKDPKVGVVTDRNFMRSAFYTKRTYRQTTRENLQKLTRDALTRSLIDTTRKPPVLTAQGAALYKNIMKNPALSQERTGSMIFRSSYTAEDRPGKSGAGQYESYVDRKVANKMLGKAVVDAQYDKLAAAQARADRAELEGGAARSAARADLEAARAAHDAFMGPPRVMSAIGVVESAWMPEPIENNVAEQFFLKHVGPTCVVQACMTPDISGVMISRNVESGARGQVTFQLVKGFGGGVDGGKATEGVITASGAQVAIVDGEAGRHDGVSVGGIQVSAADMKKLREIVLETEKYFHDVIEQGKGHAVDMEVARQDGEWKIVQARVILMDK